MYYLERNAQVIAEMQERFHPARGQVVGGSDKTTVTAIGSYLSELFGGRLYVALKEVRHERRSVNYWQRLVNDLTAVAGIANNIPQLLPKLPFFVGIIQNSNSEYGGIITEDLSQDGKMRVRQSSEGALSKDDPEIQALRNLLSGRRATYSEESLANIYFVLETPAGDSIWRMGDFDQTRFCLGPREIEERFPYDDVVPNVDRHTLVIDEEI